ncbi:MAG: DNA-directed RNA polymerase subunit omega [Verrucomicrobiota bacterium]|nr:DNA-directed RNA polymerase subunit omega [Verrucomicrobiota bacterium]
MKSHYLDELQKTHPDLAPEVIINAISKRVRQLNMGSRPLIHVESHMSAIDIAAVEITDGKVIIRQPSIDEVNALEDLENPGRARKRR